MSTVLEIAPDGYATPSGNTFGSFTPEDWNELTPFELLPEFEPSRFDRLWWAMQPSKPLGPTDQDWDEYARWSEWQDRLEQIHMVTDEDIAAAGLAVG
jgi:hypothetical protein